MLGSAAMKPGRFEIVALLLFVAIIGYQLFVPPLIGLADNGDFQRVFYPAGLREMPGPYYDKYFHYFNSRYLITPDQTRAEYQSSSILFARVARRLNILFVDKHIFDIRMLASVYLVTYLFGIYLILVSSRRMRLRWRIPLAALLLFIFTDIAYTAYFNSFYCEPTALVCLVIIIGCSLVLITGQSRGLIALIAYFISAAILITAKPMYVPFTLLFAAFGIYLSRLISMRHRYWFSGILAIALIPLGIWAYSQTPALLRLNSNYIAIFTELLKESPTPKQDLLDLGLNPDWIQYAGSSPYGHDSPLISDPSFRTEFMQRVDSLTFPKFLLAHPAQFYRMVSSNAEYIPTTLVPYSGYYEKEVGKPPLTKPPSPWTQVRRWILPAHPWFLITYFAFGLFAMLIGIFKQLPEPWRGLLLLCGLLTAISAIEFVVPIVTMGGNDPRYLGIFDLAFDTILILAIGSLLPLIELIWQKRREPSPKT